MNRRKVNPKRPGRGTKGAMNPLLGEFDQGRAYRVRSFVLQPEVMLLDANGREDRMIRPVTLAVREAQFGDTLPAFMEKLGLKMEQGQGGK